MEWVSRLIEWFQEHPALLFWLFVLGIASLVLTAVLLPLVVVKIPADYFQKPPRERTRRPRTLPNLAWHVAKNLLGVVFVLAGIAMLALPGQGLLTILIGLLIMDFPGKYGLERKLICRPRILKAINSVRSRFGKPPLVVPA